MTRGEHIKFILIAIQLAVHIPETTPANKTQHSANPVVPHEQRVVRQVHERLAQRRRDSRHEEVEAHHETPHIPRRLGERVLKTRDRREDLGDGNEHVSPRLRPDVYAHHRVALAGVVPAVGLPVDILLQDRGPDHGRRSGEKAQSDFLDGREVDAHFSQAGVDQAVEDGDQDYEREGVEVGKDIVGDAVERHGGCLRGQVVVELVVGQPVEWEPEEYRARREAAAHFVDPGVVEGHPAGPLGGGDSGGADGGPEGAVVQALVGCEGVERPAAFLGVDPEAHGFPQHGALRGGALVHVAAAVHDQGTEAEGQGGDHVGEPETDVALGVGHGDLADQRADVDGEVEVHVHSGRGDGRVDDDALSFLGRDDAHGSVRELFGD